MTTSNGKITARAMTGWRILPNFALNQKGSRSSSFMKAQTRTEAHLEVVTQIIQKEFGNNPGRITRMSNGICNEVYKIEVRGREVFARLKDEARYMFGSHNHIPI